MGLRRLLSGGSLLGSHAVHHVDTEENFAIPLKRVETDQIGLHGDILTLEKNLSVMVLGQLGSEKPVRFPSSPIKCRTTIINRS